MAHADALGGDARISAPAQDKALRVLIVDNNADAAETLVLLLEELGHATRVVVESPKAVAAALAFRPDVVFLDIGMPLLDGLEVARRLRRQAVLKHVFLATLSGWGTDRDRAKSQDAGIDRQLTKLVVVDELIDMLAGLPSAPGASAFTEQDIKNHLAGK